MKIQTFGCRLNTFESAVMSKITAGEDVLDNVIVINTCAVTGEAERQCRQAIRRARRENTDAIIVVTGCGAQIHPEEYAAMSEVDRVLGNNEKLTRTALMSSDPLLVGPADAELDLPIISDIEGRTRAFLQIQQGCDHACTYCVVPSARGKNRGLSIEQVIAQAKSFVEQGFVELVITGADVMSYQPGFCVLVDRLLTDVSGIQRLRFGSLDPAMLGSEFVALVQKYPQIMPHFHLSIQSGDNVILKRMARRHTREDIFNFAQSIRSVRSDVVLGADFITGFPTETEEQFMQTMDLVERANLTHLHVFPYSVRVGTPAAKMPQIPVVERKERAARLRALGDKKYKDLLDSYIGRSVTVLVEKETTGWTETYLKVILNNPVSEGTLAHTIITQRHGNELVG